MTVILFLLVILAAALKPVGMETLQDLTVTGKPPLMGAGVFLEEGVITVGHAIRPGGTGVWFINKNEEFFGTLMKLDREMDLALLEVEVEYEYTHLRLNPRVGEQVYVVGDPAGYEDVITFGRVIYFNEEKVMVDARITWGNSGGGVFDTKGRLLGIIHHAEPGRFGWPGDWINVAISAKQIKRFLDEED